MKKFLLATGLFVAIFIMVGGPYTTQSFINGTSVSISHLATNVTTTYLSTNLATIYVNDLGQSITNGTNASGVYYGAWGRPVRVASDSLGQAAPYSVSITTPASHATNTITVLLQRSPNGTDFDALNATWSFVVPADSSAVGQTMVTNVPTWFTTGASHIRVYSLAYATNSTGFTNSITAIKFNGFAP